MKKVYKALGPDVVEKKWLGDEMKVPAGWYSAISDAKAAWKEPEKSDKK